MAYTMCLRRLNLVSLAPPPLHNNKTSGVARNFKREGRAIISMFFFKRRPIFFGRTNLKLIEKRERFSGFRGYGYPKQF